MYLSQRAKICTFAQTGPMLLILIIIFLTKKKKDPNSASDIIRQQKNKMVHPHKQTISKQNLNYKLNFPIKGRNLIEKRSTILTVQ